jgi:L-lactate dehydrogenase complex protein LldG
VAERPSGSAPAGAGSPAAALLVGFRDVLAELDGVVHEAASLDEARARARELVGGATVARWDDAALDEIAAATAPAQDAEVSLIVADVGIADTGQIGLVHRAGRPRGVALLPSRQVALLAASDLVQSVAEALAHLGVGGPSHPGHAVLVAGPSRTADIEQRMILGVHAPRTLDVIVYR